MVQFRKSLYGLARIVALTLEAFKKKQLHEALRGGGASIGPPSTFDTIHPIGLKFGTYNKLHLYFQLSETTWCLIGFHGNNSQINDGTGGRHLGFEIFQILFKFSLFNLRLTEKQHLAVEIHEIGRLLGLSRTNLFDRFLLSCQIKIAFSTPAYRCKVITNQFFVTFPKFSKIAQHYCTATIGVTTTQEIN